MEKFSINLFENGDSPLLESFLRKFTGSQVANGLVLREGGGAQVRIPSSGKIFLAWNFGL